MPIVTFILAACVECAERYAVMPSLQHQGQWQVFPRAACDFTRPTHLCSGALLCLQGHRLRVTQPAAVLSNNGDWVGVGTAPRRVGAN